MTTAARPIHNIITEFPPREPPVEERKKRASGFSDLLCWCALQLRIVDKYSTRPAAQLVEGEDETLPPLFLLRAFSSALRVSVPGLC